MSLGPPEQPLPPNNFDPTSFTFLAYRACLSLESRNNVVSQLVRRTKRTVLVCARLLGYLLREAPVISGREAVTVEICLCEEDDEELQKLANRYIDGLLRCFRSYKGRTPATSGISTPSSPAMTKNQNLTHLVSTPTSHEDTKKQALERDKFRCLLTGKIDWASLKNRRTFRQPGDNSASTHTRCAHIFDRSTNENLTNAQNMSRFHHNATLSHHIPIQASYAASVHDVIDRFGGVSTIDELNGPRVHRLQNILTLDSEVHISFNELLVWLDKKPGDADDWYTVQTVDNSLTADIPPRVHFTTDDAQQYPLPDPRYLAIHAACARVAHLSGAAECLDEVQRDMEDICVLSDDGSSESALYNAFVRHGIPVY